MSSSVKSNGSRIVLDIFIILIILASIAGIVVRSIVDDDTGTEEVLKGTRPRMVLEVNDDYYAVLSSLLGEDEQYRTMYFADSGEIAGFIYKVSYEGEETGDKKATDKVNATVYVSMADGVWRDGSFLVHGKNYITPNDTVEFCTDTTVFEATVQSIKQDE